MLVKGTTGVPGYGRLTLSAHVSHVHARMFSASTMRAKVGEEATRNALDNIMRNSAVRTIVSMSLPHALSTDCEYVYNCRKCLIRLNQNAPSVRNQMGWYMYIYIYIYIYNIYIFPFLDIKRDMSLILIISWQLCFHIIRTMYEIASFNVRYFV